MELRIASKEDRRIVAGILADNSYYVHMGKRQKLNEEGRATRSMEMVVIARDMNVWRDDDADEHRGIQSFDEEAVEVPQPTDDEDSLRTDGEV